jgi:hypothetical protein
MVYNLYMANNKTNRQLLRKMVAEMDEMHLVFVREALVTKAQAVVEQQEQIRIDMANHVIHPDLFIGSQKKVLEFIGF